LFSDCIVIEPEKTTTAEIAALVAEQRDNEIALSPVRCVHDIALESPKVL